MERLGKVFFVVLIAGILASCGGGGGGDGSSDRFYAGIWDFRVLQVRNDCNLDIDVREIIETHTVNQAGIRVVLDRGRQVLEGEIDDEDGFDTLREGIASNGCETATAVSYKGAGDSDAGAALVIGAQCGNSPICLVGWGGKSTRRTSRSSATVDGTDVIPAILESMSRMPRVQAAESHTLHEAVQLELEEILAGLD